MHSLVTFLGKSQTGYRRTRYRFDDGSLSEETPFFGLALAQQIAPDKLVILGTAGSMWDALVEHVALTGEDEDVRLALMAAAETGCVTQDLLNRSTALVSRAVERPCELRLVPFGRELGEEVDILRTIAEAVPSGRVSFDLTHGFRHLAALGLLSAFFLERVARFEIDGLYYGAFDMSGGGLTPVMQLDGLLAIQLWIDALDRFDAGGDYGVFAERLVADRVAEDKARCLERAAFYERTSNAAKAREQISTFLAATEDGLPGAGRLFQDRLRERLDWARGAGLSRHQRHLAGLYLKRRDYLRAAILCREAPVSRKCEELGLDPNEFSARERAARELDNDIKSGASRITSDDLDVLRGLRNAMAHGSRPSARVQDILADEERLARELARLLTALCP
jgi:CRISPR-associated Csx2 family protein